MSYSPKNPQDHFFSELAIADDRDTWFEAIRCPYDPLVLKSRTTSSPLTAEDYFTVLPPLACDKAK